MPTAAVMALEAHGAIAGTASALMGTLQFLTGAVVMASVGLFADSTARPMVTAIAGCAMLTWILARLILGASAAAKPHSQPHTP